jgi:hypothetical protein
MRRLCIEPKCGRYATAKGRCDLHRREMERERSTRRRGGYARGPLTDVIAARDARDRYPKRDT